MSYAAYHLLACPALEQVKRHHFRQLQHLLAEHAPMMVKYIYGFLRTRIGPKRDRTSF
jgi:hypothetical protein